MGTYVIENPNSTTLTPKVIAMINTLRPSKRTAKNPSASVSSANTPNSKGLRAVSTGTAGSDAGCNDLESTESQSNLTDSDGPLKKRSMFKQKKANSSVTRVRKPINLGKLLVKDTTHHVPAWIVCVLSLAAAVALGTYIHLWFGAFVAIVGCAIGICGQLLFGRGDHTIKVYEHGICTVKDGEFQSIAFADVAKFSCLVKPAQSSLLREFEMTGTTSTGESQTISFETLKRSKEFNNICRKLGQKLSITLERQLTAYGVINWSAKYKMYADAIEVPVRNGVFRRIEKVHFSRINAVRINYKNSQLWIAIDEVKEIENAHSPQIKLDMSLCNFFAGLHVFEKQLAKFHGISTSEVA